MRRRETSNFYAFKMYGAVIISTTPLRGILSCLITHYLNQAPNTYCRRKVNPPFDRLFNDSKDIDIVHIYMREHYNRLALFGNYLRNGPI